MVRRKKLQGFANDVCIAARPLEGPFLKAQYILCSDHFSPILSFTKFCFFVDKILSKFCCVLHRLICGPLNAFAATFHSVFGAWTLFTEGNTLIFVNIFRIYLIVRVSIPTKKFSQDDFFSKSFLFSSQQVSTT